MLYPSRVIRRPAREYADRALKSERLRLLGWQHVRRHPEVMVGGTGQRDVINWAVRARQAEALGDLCRAAAVRARYEDLPTNFSLGNSGPSGIAGPVSSAWRRPGWGFPGLPRCIGAWRLIGCTGAPPIDRVAPINRTRHQT